MTATATTYAATGRRKEAVARVQMVPGKGSFTINGLQVADYLQRDNLVRHACEPLVIAEMLGRLDIIATANGGGKSGQAGAVRLAVSRALDQMNPDLHTTLRRGGFLTRDSRVVERKKYGHPKARKRFQYSKR